MILRLAFICALAVWGAAASAGPVLFDGSWKTQRFSLFSANAYGFQGDTLTMRSAGSVSLAYHALPVQRWPATRASWTWQVDKGVPATDLRRKGGDDRNLALYFVFLPEAEAARLRGKNVKRLLRSDAARVLVYVWGGSHARGSLLDSPYLGHRGKTLVLRPSGTGAAREQVDLARDYARAFGGAPGALVGLAVSGDSDDTEGMITAAISGLRVE